MQEPPENSISKFSNEQSFLRKISIPFIFILIVVSLPAFIYSNLQFSPNPFLNQQIIVGILAVIIVLSLSVTYYYAYKFFNKNIYIYICLGWVLNATYLIFEFFINDHCFQSSTLFCKQEQHKNINFCQDDFGFCINYSIGVQIFSLLSTIAFYYAGREKLGDEDYVITNNPSLNLFLYQLCKIPILIWVGASILPAAYIYFTAKSVDENTIKNYFIVSSFTGQIFTAFCLIFIGERFRIYFKVEEEKEREELEKLGNNAVTKRGIIRFFPITFYAYGLMQITYPFKLILMDLDPVSRFQIGSANIAITYLTILFIAASLIKLLNIRGLMSFLLQVRYHEYLKYKITENELEGAKKSLYGKNNLAILGALSASIEHDLKTPLANLTTDIETIKKAFPENTKLKLYLKRLEADKIRIMAIAKIIPFVRASGDYFNTDKFMDKISVTSLVNAAIKSVKNEMRLDTEKYFFRSNNKDFFIRAFPPMVEQIFANIFKNGIEAIREMGRDRGIIDISIVPVDNIPTNVRKEYKRVKNFKKWVRVNITDSGCGISEENLRQLTTLFSSKDKPNGGIGLYMAKKLLKIHESLMSFDSKPNQGTTVSLYFPEWNAYKDFIENSSTEEFSKRDFEDADEIQQLVESFSDKADSRELTTEHIIENK